MNFKNIFLITIILLSILSVSAISAEEISDVDNGVDVISDDVISAADVNEEISLEDSAVIAAEEGNSSDTTGNDTQSSIKSSDLVKYYKNDTQFIATFYDNDGNILVNHTVFLKINSVTYNRTTNDSGSVKFSINLGPGDYTIETTNPVTNESVTNTVKVLSTINAADITKYFRNGTQFYATILNSQGIPAANTTVTFNINGVFYNRTTNPNGTARLNINLSPGTYVITARNTNTSELKSNTIKVLSTILVKNSNTGGNISMEYNSGSKYSVALYYNNGSIAANKTATFNINGVLYDRISDANGTASLNINLRPGNYVITAEFDECKISNLIKIRMTPTVKLVNSTVKVGEPIQFYLTEKSTGNPILPPHYGILYYNGTTYGAYPDANGLVSFYQTFINNGQNLTAGSNPFCLFGTLDDGYYSSLYNGNTIKVVE